MTALAIASAVLIVAGLASWLHEIRMQRRAETRFADAIATLQGNARIKGETNAQLRRRLELRRVPRRER